MKIDYFTIKPLEWDDFLQAETPFGNYNIDTYDSGKVTWRWCFQEHYDEGKSSAGSVEEAKTAAFKHWTNRIKGGLEWIGRAQ